MLHNLWKELHDSHIANKFVPVYFLLNITCFNFFYHAVKWKQEAVLLAHFRLVAAFILLKRANVKV